MFEDLGELTKGPLSEREGVCVRLFVNLIPDGRSHAPCKRHLRARGVAPLTTEALNRAPQKTSGATPKIAATVRRMEKTLQLCSRAFLGGDGGEGRPALLDLLAAAVRANDVFLLMFGHG
jgi:hypothetical protein